ncbi:MAG: iron ABC transporter permease [Candidatus Binatia bacterium]
MSTVNQSIPLISRIKSWEITREYISGQSLILVGCTLLLIYLTAIPLGTLLYGSILTLPIGEPENSFTVQNYIDAYIDKELLPLLGNSLSFAIGSTLLAFLIGTYLAWINERTNTPLKKVFMVVALIPFIIPGVLNTIAWILLLSPKIGLINLGLKEIFNLQSSPLNIYSMWGMIWVEALHSYPLVFVLMSAAFRNMDTTLEEAALTSGSSTLATLRRITLPLMYPAALGVLLIKFVRGMEGFEVPAFIGLPANIHVFTSKIYLATRQFPPAHGTAGAYAVILLAISILGVFLYQKFTRGEQRYATVTGKGYRPRVIDLGHWKYVTFASAFVIFLLAVALPMLILLWASFIPYYGIPSAKLVASLTLDNYKYVLNYPTAVDAFRNSFYLSVGSATFVMLLTSLIAWITVKSKIPGRAILDTVAFIPIAVPGIVLGLSLLWFYLIVPIPIYGTIWILLLAYVTKYMPIGIRASSASMIQIHKELEEASFASGGSWLQTFGRVILPLLMPGFIAGWIYISVISLRELSTSILLYSHDTIVVSILAFDLWDTGQYNYVAALGIIMVIVMIAMVYFARIVGGRIGIAE